MNNLNPMMMNTQQRTQFASYFNPTSIGANASTNNIVWVQGIEGAKAWQLNPNSMIILLDSEVEGKMYIKVSDNIGMCSLRIFNYEEEVTTNNHNVAINNDLDLSQYVKKDELSILLKEILNNEQSISTTSAASTTNTTPAAIPQQHKVVTIKK